MGLMHALTILCAGQRQQAFQLKCVNKYALQQQTVTSNVQEKHGHPIYVALTFASIQGES